MILELLGAILGGNTKTIEKKINQIERSNRNNAEVQQKVSEMRSQLNEIKNRQNDD